MIKIDFAAFFKHHYWLGWYHWNDCTLHKHYESGCDYCEEGKWTSIGVTNYFKDNGESFTIFKMPMNNVLWSLETDEDD